MSTSTPLGGGLLQLARLHTGAVAHAVMPANTRRGNLELVGVKSERVWGAPFGALLGLPRVAALGHVQAGFVLRCFLGANSCKAGLDVCQWQTCGSVFQGIEQ